MPKPGPQRFEEPWTITTAYSELVSLCQATSDLLQQEGLRSLAYCPKRPYAGIRMRARARAPPTRPDNCHVDFSQSTIFIPTKHSGTTTAFCRETVCRVCIPVLKHPVTIMGSLPKRFRSPARSQAIWGCLFGTTFTVSGPEVNHKIRHGNLAQTHRSKTGPATGLYC